MTKALLSALLLLAAPAALHAQGASQTQPMPNQANPQAQANDQMQPENAHPVQNGPGLGQAGAMPTPALSKPMTPSTGTPSRTDPNR